MVKKSKKNEQKKLAIELAKKRRLTKPAVGKAENNSFSHVKDKIMRSELTDKDKRKKKVKKAEVRKGRKEAEEKGEDPEALGFPARQEPNTIEKLREADETVVPVDEELDMEIDQDEAQDEFSAHFNHQTTPKIMLTTNLKPSKRMFDFLKELVEVIPNTKYYKRKGLGLKQIIEYAKKRDFTMLFVVTEKAKTPNGLYICNLPCGPTSFWKLTKLKLGQEMRKGTGCNSEHAPELLLNNFTTRLGRRVARQLATCFPQRPDFQGRRSVCFHNQRDFVFFRHYRYEFKSATGTGPNDKKKKKSEDDDDSDKDGSSEDEDDSDMDDAAGLSAKQQAKKKQQEKEDVNAPVTKHGQKITRAGLKEIGPRFTLKMRYLQHGTFDSKNGEFEYQWRPDSQVSRKKMFL
ncbi:unnamed protein product [Amoebophrya sp. A25]|nr:unnamed protein product [Amoebophrya sp. A25]|eukprot:GSA25T00016982001.1